MKISLRTVERLGRFVFAASAFLFLVLLLSSCVSKNLKVGGASETIVAAPLPPEITFNSRAGVGHPLLVRLQVATNGEFLFIVDTGSPNTILDRSFEPLLGRRLRKAKLNYVYGKGRGGIYQAPQVFLGDIPLRTGKLIATDDCSRFCPGEPIKGILGMDCLRNYCLQLDFETKTMRFLDPSRLNTNSFGRPTPLTVIHPKETISGDIAMTVSGNLGDDGNESSWIDTGCYLADGVVSPSLLKRSLAGGHVIAKDQWHYPEGKIVNHVTLSTVQFGDESYPDVTLLDDPHGNLIGLPFLARHKLVTINFPGRVLYLQPLAKSASGL